MSRDTFLQDMAAAEKGARTDALFAADEDLANEVWELENIAEKIEAANAALANAATPGAISAEDLVRAAEFLTNAAARDILRVAENIRQLIEARAAGKEGAQP